MMVAVLFQFVTLSNKFIYSSKFLLLCPQISQVRCRGGVLLSGQVPCFGRTEQREEGRPIRVKSTMSRVPVRQI